MDRIARRVATSLDCLAEHDVVGLIDWKSSDVCKFHFFRWDIVSTTTVSHKHEGDIMSWNTLVTTSVKTDEINQTRHVHHLVNAAMHTVADYSRPMPERITKLIAEAPFWLKPHLVIVDGTETLCEVIKKKVGVVTRRNVESVLRYDPAVALGRLVLGGWGESEIATKVANEKEADSFMNTLGAFVGLMLLIVLVARTSNFSFKCLQSCESKLWCLYCQGFSARRCAYYNPGSKNRTTDTWPVGVCRTSPWG